MTFSCVISPQNPPTCHSLRINLQAQSNKHNLETMCLHYVTSSKSSWYDLQTLLFHAPVKINISLVATQLV